MQLRSIRCLLAVLAAVLLLAACHIDGLQLQMSEGWYYRSIAAWKHADPAQLALSDDEHWLYITANGDATSFVNSLIAVNMKTGRQHTLIYGLNKADAVTIAPDGTLWLGENFDDGLIWRVTNPDQLPEEQQVDRLQQRSDNPAIGNLRIAGVFAHASLVFSSDGRYLYMADASEGGGLYRFHIADQQLQVWHDSKHWINIEHPDEARTEARQLQAREFHAIRSITRMTNDQLVVAESGTGRIFTLQDGEQPRLESWLENTGLQHPTGIAWDEQRQWLWITDQGERSWLWVWDGKNLNEIARHEKGSINGIYIRHGRVFASIRRSAGGAPEAVVEFLPRPQHDG